MWNGKPINEKLVLVVDDDRSMRESLAGLLDVKGYSVLKAENGQKALDVLEKAPRFPCVSFCLTLRCRLWTDADF
jgi:CheY-like chemotaxis protein